MAVVNVKVCVCVCIYVLSCTWKDKLKIRFQNSFFERKKMEGSRRQTDTERESKGRERSGKGHTCARTLPDAGMLPPNFSHSSFPSSLITMDEITAGARQEICVCVSVERTDR